METSDKGAAGAAPSSNKVAGVAIDPSLYYSVQLGKYVPEYQGFPLTVLDRHSMIGSSVLELSDSIVDVRQEDHEIPEELPAPSQKPMVDVVRPAPVNSLSVPPRRP
jgi:hypothetical protein